VLLDVHFEDLEDLLRDKGWNVSTVTKELGASKEQRSDTNVLNHAVKTKCIVVTTDGDFVQRLESKGIKVVALEAKDKADIFDQKLKALDRKFMSEEDKIKELQERINGSKSRVLSLGTNIETELEIIMADYFTRNLNDYQLFCHIFYPMDVGLTFGIKIKIFESFLKELYPDYLTKENPDFINSLNRVRRLRNKFAHHINPKKSDLVALIDKPYFILFYMEDGLPKYEQMVWKDIEDRFNDFKNIIDETTKIMKYVQELKKPKS